MKDGLISRPTLRTGSLSRRMILIAAGWIMVLLAGGGFALDRVLVSAVTQNFDDRLSYVLRSLLVSAEIQQGEVWFSREPADQAFLEPGSGVYWQVSAPGREAFPSRSLWDRQLAYGTRHNDDAVHTYNSNQFPDEKLRIVERDVKLPGSDALTCAFRWRRPSLSLQAWRLPTWPAWRKSTFASGVARSGPRRSQSAARNAAA